MSLKKYQGSCGCGKVRFEVELDLDAGTFKCNCTLCWKRRFWGAVVSNPETLRQLSGAEDLSVFGERRRHYFCRHCGTKVFGRGADGIRVVVNVASLDNLDPKELVLSPVKFVDGRHDRFDVRPDFTDHL